MSLNILMLKVNRTAEWLSKKLCILNTNFVPRSRYFPMPQQQTKNITFNKKFWKFLKKTENLYKFIWKFFYTKRSNHKITNHESQIFVIINLWFCDLNITKSQITKSQIMNHKFCDRNHKIKSGQMHEKRLGIPVKTKSQNHKSQKITITNFVIVICDFVIVICDLWYVILWSG